MTLHPFFYLTTFVRLDYIIMFNVHVLLSLSFVVVKVIAITSIIFWRFSSLVDMEIQ